MINKEYWSQDLPRPLSPDDNDVNIFKDNMIEGKTLLLGCTRNYKFEEFVCNINN